MRKTRTFNLITTLSAFFALTLAFQNCTPMASRDQTGAALSGGGGGSGTGYDGKVYVVIGAVCPDGSAIQAAIQIASSSAQLLRENCQNLTAPVAVQVTFDSNGTIHYDGTVFQEAQPATYYVDSSSAKADDSAPGTSPDVPLKSLAPVNSRLWVPGDTILFNAGTTYTLNAANSGALVIHSSGTSAKPITFKAYGSGASPVITNPSGDSVAIVGASYIVLNVINFSGSAGAGVHIDAASSVITIAGCELTNVGNGIVADGPNNIIQYNYIHDLKMIVNTPTPVGDDSGATAFVVSSSGNEFSHNRIVNAKATCYDYGVCGGAFQINGTVNATRIHHNWIESSGTFLTSGAAAHLSDLTMWMNVSVGNTAFLDLSSSSSTFVSIRAENNTVFDPSSQTATGPLVNLSAPMSSAQLNLRNNIMVTSTRSTVYSQSGSFHTSNLYYGSGAVTLGSGEITADPLFNNTSVNDFHLTPSSPALGTGLQLGYTTNYYDQPITGGPNLGAL